MKVLPPSETAVSAARRALEEADVRRPSDIQLEAIAAKLDVMVVYERLTTAVARLVRGNGRTIITIDARLRGTPRGDFTLGHELGHDALHRHVNHIGQCTAAGEERSDQASGAEAEADQFSTELRMPEALAAPLCAAEQPGLEDVERLARRFRASFETSGIRYVELASAPCAFVRVAPSGRVMWAAESPFFSGAIANGRRVHERSAAARLVGRRAGGSDAPTTVPGSAWGAREPLLEHAISLGPRLGALSWIVPAATRAP